MTINMTMKGIKKYIYWKKYTNSYSFWIRKINGRKKDLQNLSDCVHFILKTRVYFFVNTVFCLFYLFSSSFFKNFNINIIMQSNCNLFHAIIIHNSVMALIKELRIVQSRYQKLFLWLCTVNFHERLKIVGRNFLKYVTCNIRS